MRLLPEKVDWTAYVWTVYLLFFVAAPAWRSRTTAAEWIATLGATLVFLALYFRGYWLRGRDLYPIIIAILAIGVVFLPFNAGAGSFFIYASSFAAFAGNNRVAIRIILLVELVLVLEVWLLHLGWFNGLWAFIFTAMIGAINIHFEQVRQGNSRLRMAHEEIEQLAKMAERERIARDLHDVLGHTLSLIVLKSELAAKLADRDMQRAIAEIRDVERISRDALAEVRQAVSGYRAGWRSELEAATEMLRTASIEVVTSAPSLSVSPAQEAVLSICLREAATNVVRHAQASRCEITLEQREGAIVLTVSDNGRGGDAPEGFGLTGMRERVVSAGGTLVRDGSRGTTLSITLPVPRIRMEQTA